jgi:hypothetical protein
VCFFASFVVLTAASFAFLLAILSPHWTTIELNKSNVNVTVERGIFHICELLFKNSTSTITKCTPMDAFDQNPLVDRVRYGAC